LNAINFTGGGQVLLINCDNCIISSLNVSRTSVGIYLYQSNNNNLTENTAKNNIYGIYLHGSSDFNQLTSNTIEYNTKDGIYINEDCNDNSISRNTVRYNTQHGIYLIDNCDSNNASRNTFTNNNGAGVCIEDNTCNYNLFYLNYFTGEGSHAQDNSGLYTNQWNNKQIGNYWSSYTGADLNDDGIGDSSHVIGYLVDFLPIWEDGCDVNCGPGGDSTTTPDMGAMTIAIITSIIASAFGVTVIVFAYFLNKKSKELENLKHRTTGKLNSSK